MNPKTLSNKNMKIDFSQNKGNLKELYLNGSIKWNDVESYFVIIDELKNKSYKDTENPLVFSQKKYQKKGEQIIENKKRFKGADFAVRETWKLNNESLTWRIEVSLEKGKKERTIQIKQLIPYPKDPYGLGVWSAQSQFPTTIERLGGLHLEYGDICYGTVIPAVTLYRKKEDIGYGKQEDIGLTITKPLGFKTSKLSFFFQDHRSTGMEIETTLLGLRKDKPAIVEFIIYPHQGCWRPGLAWLYKKYPQYFDPPNRKIRELEGGFFPSRPFITEEKVKSAVPYNIKWEELHYQFPFYGQYAPREKVWENFTATSKLREGDFDSPEKKISSKSIKDHIKMVHKYNIKSLIYFQCAGDGYIPYVTKNFPDAIARDAGGHFFPAYPGTYLMNSDPSTSFGKEMLNMIDRLFKKFPDIDGVFLDQLCYSAIDTAHDDGVTMFKNKPAYSLWHCYEKPVKKLADKLHKQGKFFFANGPYNIEVQKEIDGHMAESSSWAVDVIKYLCISKPLLFLPYGQDARQVESSFQQCLLAGASYSVWPFPSQKVKKVYKTYIPLVEKLFGRKWLLEPDPINLPEGFDGDIFIGEKGEIIVTMISGRKSIFSKGGLEKDLKIHVKFKDADKIRKGYSMGAHYQGRKNVQIKKDGKRLEITIAEHSSATVVVLQK